MQLTRLIILPLILLALKAEGQTIEDALRYSYLNQQGTARSIGVGGAMGALGADFSAVSINPAGLGAFWRSEISFTPSFFGADVRSSLNGGPETTQDENKFTLGSAGVVFVNEGRNGGTFRTVSLGISANKLAQFNQNIFFSGNSPGSITDRFAALSDGFTPDELDDFEAGIAYEAGAIFDSDDDLFYETDFDGSGSVPFAKEQSVFQAGSYTDFNISLGANLKDRILLGLAVGVPFLHYESEKIYLESDVPDDVPAFNSLQFREELTADGAGVNIKVGAIAKLSKAIRLGVAFHTPTLISMTESFSTSISYSYNDGNTDENFSSASPAGNFEYNLTTPWRAIGSASVLVKQTGFISADIEFINYGAARFDFTSDSDNIDDLEYQNEVNQLIQDAYRGALNFRVGGEYAYNTWRGRAGIQLLGSPFEGDNTIEQIYSAGLGYRGNKAYIDMAFMFSTNTEGYSPYQISGAPAQLVENRTNRSRIALTLGFKI